MALFGVKNWLKYQHYKDRNPPWIKLYKTILTDYAFCSLPDASKFHYIGIMLLAAREGNEIPYDSEWVRQQIAATARVDLDILKDAGLLLILENREQSREGSQQNAGNPQATRKQPASMEIRLWFENVFWKEYPRGEGKAKALERILRLKPDDELQKKIMGTLLTYKATEQWQDPKYIPHATTWLNAKRWEDEIKPGQNGKPKSAFESEQDDEEMGSTTEADENISAGNEQDIPY